MRLISMAFRPLAAGCWLLAAWLKETDKSGCPLIPLAAAASPYFRACTAAAATAGCREEFGLYFTFADRVVG